MGKSCKSALCDVTKGTDTSHRSVTTLAAPWATEQPFVCCPVAHLEASADYKQMAKYVVFQRSMTP